IEVTEGLERALGEEGWRMQDDDGASESDSERESNSDAAADEGGVLDGQGRDRSSSASQATVGEAAADQDDVNAQLFTGGLEKLRRDLEETYVLDNVAQVSYAVAVNIHCLKSAAGGDSGSDKDEEVLCMLADRRRVLEAYGGNARAFTFYPLGFHQRYGNFSSPRPPPFLQDLLTLTEYNLSQRNGEQDVFRAGFFQAYTNVKRSIRHGPRDLLATKGIATAALTLPPSAAAQAPARVGQKQAKLLLRHNGLLKSGDSSKPFARERERVELAIREEELACRMEQVFTAYTDRFVDSQNISREILNPVSQTMKFFLRQPRQYIGILRTFKPDIFPKIL
ncbi:hypothetical protein K4F52_010390, partial [Lecanicillium sp. MT-2017a]